MVPEIPVHAMIGTKLAHYEITSHLGSGGMGDVYQATDSKLGRSVAVKLLPDAFARDADRLTRFEREARVLASLNHPNVAAIYGLEDADGQKFLVMDWCPARRWPSESRGVRSRWTRRSPSQSRSPTRWRPRTRRASSIGT